MFYWCWIQVEQGDHDESYAQFDSFVLISLALYYFWHVIFWIFSLIVTMAAGCILWGHLAASSETRKFVLRQNLYYVSVLGIETLFIIIIWVAQFSLIKVHYGRQRAYFFTTNDIVFACLYAFVHSMRGTVDLFVWAWTFAIGPLDFTDCYRRYRSKFSSSSSSSSSFSFAASNSTAGGSDFSSSSSSSASRSNLRRPLLSHDNLVNKALRRNAMYCINVGILDAVELDQERCRRNNRIGSVRETFSAAKMIRMDQENQRDEVEMLYTNPTYRDQSVRRIQFPASSSHLKEFSFIDIEPQVFSLLRETYGISPRTYRKSFEIRNAADIDSSKMLEKFTEGKSGSFFYFTHDRRFIIKTVTRSEERFLRQISFEYYRHMRENEDSLIVRFFGLHKVRLAPEQRYITVVVMENIFHNPDELEMHRRFDLKGSWVGRRTLRSTQSSDHYKGTLKDLDLGEEKVMIGSENKEQLMEQLQRDVAFLTKCRIMDYSLLLGIHQHGSAAACSPTASASLISTALTNGMATVTAPAIAKAPPPSTAGPLDGSGGNKKTLRHGTITSMYAYEDEFHVPWFRQDSGGLHSCSRWNLDGPDGCNRDSMVNVGNPPVTYFFGVVDILQEYSLRKKLEHVWKTRVLRQDRHGLSAVNETEYGERFLKFLDGVFV